MTRLAALIVAILVVPGALHAEKRVALVFGNDNYSEVAPLKKARNDARSVADSLGSVSGFDVTVALDADRRRMNREIARFVSLYRSAAGRSNARGFARLGNMYLHGNGVEKHPERAAGLYRMAADQGNSRGQASLGNMYLKGIGVELDHPRAISLYRLAAGQGDTRAMNDLAMALAKKPSQAVDFEESARLLITAARKGDKAARKNLERANRRLPVPVRMEIQKILRDAGHYFGPIDGILGEQTRSALRRHTEG